MGNNEKKRRWHRILSGCAACSIAIAVLLGLMWAQRPRWRTYLFPADPKTGIAVAIDYPDDWQLGTMLPPRTEFASMMQIQFRPQPPKEMARWWLEKVLRQDVTDDDNENIQVDVMSGSDYKDLPAMEKEAHVYLTAPGNNIRLTHERHALGPALAAYGTVSMQPMGGPQSSPPFKIYGMLIWPQATNGADKTNIAIITTIPAPRYPRFGIAVAAMIPRVHLVRKKR